MISWQRIACIKKHLSLFLHLVLALSLLSIGTLVQANTHKTFTAEERDYLIGTFKDSGIDETLVISVFSDRRLAKSPVVVEKNVVNEDRAEFYKSFYNSYSIKIAYRFSRKWRTVLRQASEEYQVDKDVLTAILLVETGLGNVLGRYRIVSVFSSILVEDYRWRQRCHDERTISYAGSDRGVRLGQKAKWAQNELLALLKIAQKTGKDAYNFRGSYAGAFGIPQFLPSSYLKWGIDSDKNGTVNLFLFPDAIHSIANYLKSHGWKKGLYLESNKDVIWQYNRSQNYVDAVLKVAGKLKKYHRQNIASNKEKTESRSQTI